MFENKYSELECECGGLCYPSNARFNTGEYWCDSCNKIYNSIL